MEKTKKHINHYKINKQASLSFKRTHQSESDGYIKLNPTKTLKKKKKERAYLGNSGFNTLVLHQLGHHCSEQQIKIANLN